MGRARARVPPPLVCALGRSASSQSNQRLCPLLRRDFQRWLHWRVTDAEIPGVLRFSSSRQPLTLVKRQRGDTEATSRGGPSGGPRGAGAEATSQGGSSGGSEMALENSGQDGVPNTSDGRQASLRHARVLRDRDGPGIRWRPRQERSAHGQLPCGTPGPPEVRSAAAYSNLRRTYPLATMRRGCSCSP